MATIQEDIDAVCKAIPPMPLEADPFVHGVAENFLPQNVYAALADGFPTLGEMTARSTYNGTVDPISRTMAHHTKRFTMSVTLSSLKDVALANGAKRFAAIMLSAPVAEAWVAVFRSAIAKSRSRLGGGGGLTTGVEPVLEFVRDESGYALPPHTDGAAKLLSALIYLGTSEEQADIGTCIFEPMAGGVTSDGVRGYSFSSMREVRRVAVKANRCLAFARTPTSFQGVREVEPGRIRTLVQCSLVRRG